MISESHSWDLCREFELNKKSLNSSFYIIASQNIFPCLLPLTQTQSRKGVKLTVWALKPPHPHSSCRRVPMCPGWSPSQHQTAARRAPDGPRTPPSALPAAVEAAEAAAETPCETSSCGAAAWRLPAAPGEDRETGRGGGRWRAETPRRSWEESREEKRSRGRRGGGGEKRKEIGARQCFTDKKKRRKKDAPDLTPNSSSLLLTSHFFSPTSFPPLSERETPVSGADVALPSLLLSLWSSPSGEGGECWGGPDGMRAGLGRRDRETEGWRKLEMKK